MKNINETALSGASSSSADGHIPMIWSDSFREQLRRVVDGETPATEPLERELTRPLLMCADGEFERAEIELLYLLQLHPQSWKLDNSILTRFLSALFAVQRLDLIAAILRHVYGFAGSFEIDLDDAIGCHRFRWEISNPARHKFVLERGSYQRDDTRLAILHLQWLFPLCAYYASQPDQECGAVIVNVGDIGLDPGFAFSDNRPDRFLIPDFMFVPTRGYKHLRDAYDGNPKPWATRKPVALWRGSTTGTPRSHSDWQSLERVRLCMLATRSDCAEVIDAGITSVVQFDDPVISQEIKKSGLMRDFIRAEEWHGYKYQIDIDGNSNAWTGLFYRLLTGSPVLKVGSYRGYQQWYYDRMVPWVNYIPVAPDMSDLVDKVKWISRNDSTAESIGRHGRELADELSYEAELNRAVPVISSAFRYFRGETDHVGPHGRTNSRIIRSDDLSTEAYNIRSLRVGLRA